MDDPDCDVTAYNTFYAEGTMLEQAGSEDKAIECYSKALDAVTPNGIMAYTEGRNCLTARSRCLLKMGDQVKALEDAEASLKEDKKFIKGLFAKAEALYYRGDFEYALMFYHRGNKLRPELDQFRMGISKASEAIDNSIGKPEACKLEATGDLTLFHQRDARAPKGKKKKERGGAAGKTSAKKGPASDRTIKQLLGELYADRKYLQDLLEDPTFVQEGGVKGAASSGLDFLDKRTEFWRQQKPITARVNEQKMKMTSTARRTGKRPASKANDGAKNAMRSLEDIDRDVEAGECEQALKKGKELLRTLGNMTMTDKQRVVGSVHSAMGNAHLKLGRLDDALQSHNKDLDIAESKGYKDAKSRALGNLGRTYVELGDHQQALETFSSCLPLTSSVVEKAWIYHEIGRCQVETGEHESAMENGQKCHACAIETNDRRWELNAGVLIAQAQVKLGQFPEALASFEGATDIASELDDTKAKDAIEKAVAETKEQMVTSAPAE